MNHWDDTPDGYFFDDGHSKAKIYAAINAANLAVPLDVTFKKYGIKFEIMHHNPKGWTHRCSCPLPHHNDVTPSFGYNSIEGRFYCFGCKASGKTVEFIHLMEGTGKYLIANQLLSQSSTEISHIPVKENHRDEIRASLIELSKTIHQFLDKDPSVKKIDFASSIMWNVEIFLLSKKNKNIDLLSLEKRIILIKKYLSSFQENI